MFDEPPIAYVMLGIMTLLEIILIRMQISKIRAEKKFAKSSEIKSAIVRYVTKEQSISRMIIYTFVVDAENGLTYTVSGSGIRASMIKVGDTVNIYVPNGFELMPEDEYFESVISGGKEAIVQLSDSEKERLMEYMKKRTESIYGRVTMIGKGEIPSLTSEGRGLKKEILPGFIFIAVMAFFILMFAYYLITGR